MGILDRLDYKKRGFSIVEILVALGLFVGGFTTIAFFSIDTLRYYEGNLRTIKTNLIIQEVVNAFSLGKTDLWSDIIANSDGNPKRLVFSNNQYSIVDGTEDIEGLTFAIYINLVYRDLNGSIVEATEPNAFIDYHSRRVMLQSTWINSLGQNEEISFDFLVYDWNVSRLEETTDTDFNDGLFDLTITQAEGDGEIRLESVIYADWCSPSNALTSYDLPGQGIAKTISTDGNVSLMGTGANASGISLSKSTITDAEPPVVNNIGTFDGYKTNDIVTNGQYAYIGTDTNGSEIVIIDTNTNPFSEVGYFDAVGPTDVDAVALNGNELYAGADNTFYIVDVSSVNGARTSLGSVGLSGNATAIIHSGDYVYVGTTSTTSDIEIIDISIPSTPTVVGSVNINTTSTVTALAIDSTSNVLFAGTDANTSYPEIFIIDITTKTGSHSAGATYDSNGTSVGGIIVVQDDERLVFVGNGGQEYQALDITTPFSPTYCGGNDFDNGANDVSGVYYESTGNAYAYILTNDSSGELKIARGGAGGGGENGVGYTATGTYESNVIDFNSDMISTFYLDSDQTIPAGTNLRIQIRAGNSTNLSAVPWVGPDGTGTTFYEGSEPMLIPAALANYRYFQYKVYFTSDTVLTPLFESIRIYYQEL